MFVLSESSNLNDCEYGILLIHVYVKVFRKAFAVWNKRGGLINNFI